MEGESKGRRKKEREREKGGEGMGMESQLRRCKLGYVNIMSRLETYCGDYKV